MSTFSENEKATDKQMELLRKMGMHKMEPDEYDKLFIGPGISKDEAAFWIETLHQQKKLLPFKKFKRNEAIFRNPEELFLPDELKVKRQHHRKLQYWLGCLRKAIRFNDKLQIRILEIQFQQEFATTSDSFEKAKNIILKQEENYEL